MTPWHLFPAPPRQWQAEALPLAMASIRAGVAGVTVACTGAGKSWYTAAICASILEPPRPLPAGHIVVVTVPTESLVRQTAQSIGGILPGRVGEWYGRRKALRPVTVCCYDSLETLADNLDVTGTRVACWLADECHRAGTERIAEQVIRLNPRTRHGMTATPFVAGDAGLRGWDQIVYRYTIDQAVADGVLVPYRPIIPTNDEELTTDEVVLAMLNEYRPAGPGVVSATDIEDAEFFAGELTAHGYPARAIHSRQPQAMRDELIRQLQHGDLRALVHVSMLVEGVDFPWLRWGVFRRPTQSPVRIVQELGRYLRTDPAGDKTEALIFLPHLTPLARSLARTYDELGPQQATVRALAGAPREPRQDPLETLLPLIRSSGDAESYCRALIDALADAGHGEPAPDAPGAAPVGQVRALTRAAEDRRKWGGRYLPSDARAVVAAVADVPELVSRGTVAGLLRTLGALRQAAGMHYHQNKRKPARERYWSGYRGPLPPVPEDLATFAHEREKARQRAQRKDGTK